MRTKLLIAVLAGFILGQLFTAAPAYAQSIVRLYGTFSGGPIPLAANSSGQLIVIAN